MLLSKMDASKGLFGTIARRRQKGFSEDSSCCLRRFLSRRYHELSYARHGEPADVLEYLSDPTLHDQDAPAAASDPSTRMIRVEMQHVPWNPADVNTVQGRYASPYPSSMHQLWGDRNRSRYFDGDPVHGSEGWGRVTGSNSDGPSASSPSLPEGSLVTMGLPGLGTLRSSVWLPESALLTVPEPLWGRLGPAGCTLFQLGGTALRMLTDFVPLRPGDVVLQNAGNSGVGVLASQLAASSLFRAATVTLVRRGARSPEEFDEMADYLTRVGKSAFVVAEEDVLEGGGGGGIEALQARLRDLSGTGSLPKLALNAVGGDSAKLLLKLLEPGGTMVTYGGMSGKPVQVATPQLVFKDVRLVGYWHSRWMVQQPKQSKQDLIDALAKAVLEEDVHCPPVQVFPLHDCQRAIRWQSRQDGPIRSKLVWDCRESQ